MMTARTISVMRALREPWGFADENDVVWKVSGAFVAVGIGPVSGLLGPDDFMDACMEDAGDAETRSLILMVCDAGFAVAPGPIADIAGFAAAVVAVIGILAGPAPAAALIGWAWTAFADSIFLSVSSTSAACQPAPVSVAFMVSRETPSFI